ncbi:serine/threonine protein kinase [Entomophthora muscae]|uniref:Serine/threonine protein kinase n=3 Tax=Entomophthora muscae TaxID=34485 RepID=A0ACC2UFW7_9FUNG|nr:serine/threonine protein kinase [Entomophthora muscae]KAJ9085292.1 serine/threonine protein kinase [Entomophthora muscae]
MELASPAPSSSTLNDFKSTKSLRPSRFSILSFGRIRNAATPASSTTSLSDDGSEGTLSSVPTRFVLDAKRLSSSFDPTRPNHRLYRPVKYCRRQGKEVSALPHQVQILYDRGTTPLSQDYDLLNRKLGDGAMGSVYLVQRKADKKLFAAKMHSKDHAKLTRPQYLQRIADEVIIASSMHHKHIIATVDFVSNGGKYLTIMEFCPTDLFDVISSNTLTPEQIDIYFVQLLLGVSHLHSTGVAHRDLKLENMCVDKHGQLKIIDFGCATSFRATFSSQPSLVKGVYGSDPYIAPEIWEQFLYDAVKADMWSLGVVYVAMQSGRFLWDKAQPLDGRYSRFLDRAGATLTKFKIPTHSHPLLMRLLDPNPNTRASLEDCFEEPWVAHILETLK